MNGLFVVTAPQEWENVWRFPAAEPRLAVVTGNGTVRHGFEAPPDGTAVVVIAGDQSLAPLKRVLDAADALQLREYYVFLHTGGGYERDRGIAELRNHKKSARLDYVISIVAPRTFAYSLGGGGDDLAGVGTAVASLRCCLAQGDGAAFRASVEALRTAAAGVAPRNGSDAARSAALFGELNKTFWRWENAAALDRLAREIGQAVHHLRQRLLHPSTDAPRDRASGLDRLSHSQVWAAVTDLMWSTTPARLPGVYNLIQDGRSVATVAAASVGTADVVRELHDFQTHTQAGEYAAVAAAVQHADAAAVGRRGDDSTADLLLAWLTRAGAILTTLRASIPKTHAKS